MMENPKIPLDTPPCGQSLLSNPMKTTKTTMFSALSQFGKLACTLVAGAFITTQAHSAMLLHYNFSEGTGTTSANLGTVTGATATFSGGAGFSAANNAPRTPGFSMDNSAAGSGGVGRATITNASLGSALDNLTNFTVTGWYKADQAQSSNSPRLFNKALNTIGNQAAGGLALLFNDADTLQFNVGGISFTSGNTNTIYDDVGSWVFFAVTFTGGTGGGGAFYAGVQDPNTPITAAVGTYNTTLANIGSNTQDLVIGNRSPDADANRAFDGFLDDFRFYDEILTVAQIEAIRVIPEPSGFALLGFSAMGLLLRRRR